MAYVIDGKKLALEREKELKQKLQKLDDRPKVVSFLIGDDPNSRLYTQMKQEKAKELGIDFRPLKYLTNTEFEEIANKIRELNKDNEIIGIMIQLPLPTEFSNSHHTHELLELINPKKDIDGLNPRESNFIPATVKGVLSILDHLKINFKNNIFAVVGSEGEIGQSLVYELTQRDAVVIKVDKKLPETSLGDIKNADVVISATGVKNLIKGEHIKKEVILIDVGLGDFDKSCFKKAQAYTPKVGGTGPITVISLMENIVDAAERLSS